MKYHNTKCEYEGMKFDSKKEMNRYIQLKGMLDRGEISNLRRQEEYELIPKNDKYRKVSYKADFVYEKDNEEIIEDTKSVATLNDKVFQLKRKLFYHRYGKEISIFL